MGGTVAFEMGCRLRAEGESNVSVWLFDTWGPGYIRYSDSALVCQFHKQVNRVRSHCINFFGRSGVDKLTYIKQVSRNVIDKFCCAIGVTDPTPISASIRSVWRANNHAITHFQLGSYDGEVVLFRASWQPSDANNDETLGWRPLVHGELVIREVSGYHGECCLEPHVASLAEAVNAELRRLSSEPVGA
jgi:thioesterase domain-containing protein